MKKIASTLLLACLVLTGLQAQTADEVIDTYFEVTGGKDGWKNIESVKMKGKASMQGMEFPMSMVMKKPANVYQEVSFQGKKIVTAYDGSTGWMINPLAMMMEPTKLPEDQLEQFDGQKVEDELLDYASKGHTVAYEGTEDVTGTECHKIKLTKKEGDIEYHYFDTDTGIKIMQRSFIKTGPAKGQASETFFADYDEVNGLYFPFSLESKVQGQTVFQATMEEIELNADVSDDLFAFPEK